MTFSVNHPILFLLAGIIILAVLAQSVFFLVRALRRGRQIGMDMQKLKKTMLTAGVFTIAPAVAIAVSSIVTTVIIILGVVLIIPLTPVLESPALAPAFAQILPALFGGLGVVFISKNAKLAVAPICLMLVLFIFVPALNAGTVGIMVPVSVLFTVGVARILYKKGIL